MKLYPFIIYCSLAVFAMVQASEFRFDISGGNFVCQNSEQMSKGHLHTARIEKKSDSDFTVTYQYSKVTPQGPEPAEPKIYSAKGYMGDEYGEVTFSGGKYAVRRATGSQTVISRIWMPGQVIDFLCYQPPQPSPNPEPIPGEIL